MRVWQTSKSRTRFLSAAQTAALSQTSSPKRFRASFSSSVTSPPSSRTTVQAPTTRRQLRRSNTPFARCRSTQLSSALTATAAAAKHSTKRTSPRKCRTWQSGLRFQTRSKRLSANLTSPILQNAGGSPSGSV